MPFFRLPLSRATFATKVDYTTGSGPYSVAVVDVNGDGKPDVVTANSGASTASVLFVTCSGSGCSTPVAGNYLTGGNAVTNTGATGFTPCPGGYYSATVVNLTGVLCVKVRNFPEQPSSPLFARL